MAHPKWLVAALVATLTTSLLLLPLDASLPPGLDEAIEAQRAALENDPRDPALLNDLGNLLALVGQTEEAEAAYREALEVDPDRVSTRFNLGLLLQESGRVRSARKAFEAVVKTDPDHAWAHYQLGRILSDLGRQRDAIRHYSRAFRLEPRLGLPDYNPHILDNELAVQGVLGAYAGGAAAALTPRHYQHPDQVRRLLLPESPTPAEPLVDGEAGSDEASRAIGPAEIEGMPDSGQAVSGQAVSAPAGRQGRGVSPPRTPAPVSARDQAAERIRALRQQLGTPAAEAEQDEGGTGRSAADGYEDEGSVPADEPVPGRQAAPGGTGFQPGVFSTGRLERRVVPMPANRGDEPRRAG